MRILQGSIRWAVVQTKNFIEHPFRAGKSIVIQNSYLKKSPVTLSYEKLLKFVHSVQQRNGISINQGASVMLKSGIYGEKDM